MTIVLLVARILLGLGMASHGAQKLFGWYGGYGIKGTGGFFEGLGFKPGPLFAVAAGLGEFGGGMLTALGLGGPIGPALIIMVMIVAILTVHLGHGFFVTKGGAELPLTYISGSLLLAFAGPGALSLDGVFGLSSIWSVNAPWIAVAAAVVLALLNLVARRPAAQKPAAQS